MAQFDFVDQVRYEGPGGHSQFAIRHYDAERKLLGKTMRDHLRPAVCYWHTFCSFGADMFGDPLFARPWNAAGEPMAQARLKAAAAFEFFAKLGVPYYCFHDIDVAPDGATLREYCTHLDEMVGALAGHQERSGVKLLWCTANLYVLWGGREGYDTLLNTDLARERRQFGRFMQMVVEQKHRIGFKGTLLIEPKPHEPTKHQYDRDVATVHGFLREFGLEGEMKLNVECNHATLAGHSFQHEVAQAVALGVLGSIDANRGDPQNGWDTDQFPNSVEELTLVLYEILKGGGLGSGGFNFDAKVRRQSLDLEDMFHAHIGALDVLALALDKAARLVENDVMANFKAQRYAGWEGPLGQAIRAGRHTLDSLAQLATDGSFAPQPASGRQEWLEGRVNQIIFG